MFLCSGSLDSDQLDFYQSKLVVFRSMSKFLNVALRSFTTNGNESRTSTSSNPTWGFSSAFLEPTAYEPFNALFRPTINLPPDSKPPIRRWKAEVDPEDDAEHFAFDCRSKKFESADAPYSLQELHNVILSTTLSDLDSDPKLAGQRSDFEMVCLIHSCDCSHLRWYIISVWRGHCILFSCLISSIRHLLSSRRAPRPFRPS
jgi:hypothetical protein